MKCICGLETMEGLEICDLCYCEILEKIWNRPFTLAEAREKGGQYV